MVNTMKKIPKNNYQPSTPLTILSSFKKLPSANNYLVLDWTIARRWLLSIVYRVCAH